MEDSIKNLEDLTDTSEILEILGIDENSLVKEPQTHLSAGIIGTAGHVDHGKSTLTQALTGKFPDTYSEELIRGITIKLGYSHLDVLLCKNCPYPSMFTSNAKPVCPEGCGEPLHVRCYSILDHPGHEILISTMLSGASLIDYGLIVIAADEPVPMPQTREHVLALQIMGVKNIIVAQNKIELVSKEKALENYNQIIDFFKNETQFGVPPIIPVSAALGINIDALLAAIVAKFKPIKGDANGDPLMYIARSFDPNLPGRHPKDLIGGAIGGALKRGELKVGDEIEIRPGLVTKEGEIITLFSEVVSIRTDGGHPLNKAEPHTLIGVATNLDPSATKADRLAGSVVGKPGSLPDVVRRITVRDINLFPKIIGAKVEVDNPPIRKDEILMVTVGTNVNLGKVLSIHDDNAEILLSKPIAFPKGEIVGLGRQVEREFRLIGYGKLDY
ncbi:MAG: translation initiation factor IF-2 subunit gamma [Candidatus Njordarchaeia archaeon]